MLKKIASGCMCGTGLASPILFEFRNIWFLVALVNFLSAVAFMQQNQQEIMTFGPFTLVAVTFLGFAAYSSARTPLKELVPWLPTALCLFVLLTVHFFPKLRQLLQRENGIQIAMEEGRPFDYHEAPMEPGSIQSEEDFRSRHQSLDVNRWLEYDTAYIGGGGQASSRHSGALSIRGSDIDLEDKQSVARPFVQRMISPSRAGYNISDLPDTASESGFPPQRFAAGPSSQPRNYRPRSLSPDSIIVEGSSSTVAGSERPFLG